MPLPPLSIHKAAVAPATIELVETSVCRAVVGM
jgi:hypothetical protein